MQKVSIWDKYKTVCAIGFPILLFFLIFEQCQGDHSTKVGKTEIITGTLTDTIRIEHTKIVTKPTEKIVYRDIVQEVIMNDTTFVHQPIDTIRTQNFTKTIEDEHLRLDMTGVVTGRLEGISVDYKIKPIEYPVMRRKRFGIGLQAGYGVDLKPYAGIGVSYNLITF